MIYIADTKGVSYNTVMEEKKGIHKELKKHNEYFNYLMKEKERIKEKLKSIEDKLQSIKKENREKREDEKG